MIRRLLLCVLALSPILSLVACGSGGGGSSNSPLSISTSTVPNGVANSAYSVTLSATGGTTPYAWSLTGGSLPAGLGLSRGGVISGTPTAAGTSSFTVEVVDSESPPSIATATFSLIVNAALQITTSSLPAGSLGVGYSQPLSATGGVLPYSWMVIQGSLPAGLTLSAGGVISGTPTASGMSTFTVQVSDSETPAATATASLSITINLSGPPRNAALYVQGPYMGFNSQVVGFAIAKDGSLSSLPTLVAGSNAFSPFIASPKLPLLFSNGYTLATNIGSLLVNPDYSLDVYDGTTLPNGATTPAALSTDPTGTDLYVVDYIDANNTLGITIVTADGFFSPVGTTAIPNVFTPAMVFTPDAKLGFVSTCASGAGNLLSFVRSSDGTLSAAGSLATSSGKCLQALAVSADGKYLASDEVQIYSIAVNGTLTPVLTSPFTFTLNGYLAQVKSLLWDASGSYVIVGVWGQFGPHNYDGGVSVLSFSGTDLTETVPPTEGPIWQLQMTGSFVYALPWNYPCINSGCGNIIGYNFQNGQLTPLPGSPYANVTGTMAIY